MPKTSFKKQELVNFLKEQFRYKQSYLITIVRAKHLETILNQQFDNPNGGKYITL